MNFVTGFRAFSESNCQTNSNQMADLRFERIFSFDLVVLTVQHRINKHMTVMTTTMNMVFHIINDLGNDYVIFPFTHFNTTVFT